MGRSIYTPRNALAIAYQWIDYGDETDYSERDIAYREAVDDMLFAIKTRWPAFKWPYSSRWIDNEGLVMLANGLCSVVISSYGSLLAASLIANDDAPQALAERWAASIAARFERLGSHYYGGTMSNGESFYRPIRKETEA